MDWSTNLHATRKREIELIFSGCPPRAFPAALELGAGDGYQSTLLEAYVDRLVVTDLDVTRIPSRRSDRVDVRQCDAEAVGEAFPAAEFDLVFSSNMLDDVPDLGLALRSVHKVLRDDGVTVHVIPSPFWKLCSFGLFFPLLIPRGLRYLARRTMLRNGKAALVLPNEPRTSLNGTSWGQRLWPPPVGPYRGHLEEYLGNRKTRWLHEFRRAGFRVVRVLKGPVCSGHGLGWERLRHGLERSGFTGEYVYVATKQGRRSPYEKYFTESCEHALPGVESQGPGL